MVGHGPPSLSPSASASASGYSFPWASTSPCCSAPWDEQRCTMAGGSWSAFWISLTPQQPQPCCLHKGTAGNMAGKGQDSSYQQQPFLRPAWWDHFSTTPVPQAAVQTVILLGLHMHTHSLNTKSSKTSNSWKQIFNAKILRINFVVSITWSPLDWQIFVAFSGQKPFCEACPL